MDVWNTLRVAARSWRRTPALAALIVLTLTLGIGTTTSAFTIAYSVLVQRFPFPQADRLMWVTTHDTRASEGGEVHIASNRLPQFADWHEHLTTFESIAAWSGQAPDIFTVAGAGTPERVSGLRVTHQLLPMLGATPVVGRLFQQGDDRPRAQQTVVLSHAYWQRYFSGRTDILGRTITIENQPHAIVGVVSPEFPLSGSIFKGAPIDLFVPLTIEGNEDIGGFMAVVGRLRPGTTAEQAQAELASRQQTIAVGKWQWMTALTSKVTPLADLVTRETRSPVLLLLAGVGCVLLMACVNLANLMLVRSSGRRREMQVRAALGASLDQLFRGMLAESAVLVGIGGAAGIGLAVAITEALRRETWLSLARLGDISVGWPALAFTLLVCAIVTVAFGSTALLHVRRQDIMDGLRPNTGISPDPRAVLAQRVALATQVAVVVVLAVAGGLLLRSLTELVRVDPGFDPRGAMAIRVDPANRLPVPARLPFFNDVVQRIESLPGVQSAALTINVPMGDRPSMGWDAIPEGRDYNPSTDNAAGRIVSPGYFRTIGIALLAGRDFESRDVRSTPYVMAINETFARRIRAEGGDPLQSRFRVLGNVRQVVAVVSDVKHRGLDADAGREVYIPIAQAPGFFQAYDLIVRAADPAATVPSIRAAIWDIDRNQALGTPVLLEDYIGRTLRPRRLLTGVIGVFGGAALLLAAFGVYGIVGYRMSQRIREIAIRVALGAPRWRVSIVVMRDTVNCVAIGLAVGLPLALAASSAIRSYLFGVAPDDVSTVAGACALVVGCSILAAYLPARRAGRVDPIASLRAE